MSVTLSEVKRAAKAHRAPLAGESAGYLVLALADQVLSAPRLVHEAQVQLTEDGALRVISGHASSDADAELSLRRALDQLLLVASSGSAALTRASRRTAPLGLPGLVRELEAALIPVNRAAARRALARVHRETARALASGVLPNEEPEAGPEAALPVATLSALPVSVPPVSAPPVSAPPTTEIRALVSALPKIDESRLDGVLGALCEQLPAPPELQESDALTRALEVRAVIQPEPALELEIDVEFEAEAVEAADSGAAPTVMRAMAVQPVALYDEDSQAFHELPSEACTRPEPVVLRKSLRPPAVPVELLPSAEGLPRTPTLGSLAAALPVLAPEQIAELNEQARAAAAIAAAAAAATADNDAHTEQMPEVAALSPGVAMVASHKSDVSELLSSFQIGPDDSNQGLCRAIKELADLDLTPAPFAALIR